MERGFGPPHLPTRVVGELHGEVYNALGVKAYETTWRNGDPQVCLRCTAWPSGNYWTNIESDNHKKPITIYSNSSLMNQRRKWDLEL